MTGDGRALETGRAWEQCAADFLEQQGLRLIARGYRCRLGELDIIASDGTGLVVVEVRARRSGRHGTALESVGPAKQHRIVQATRHFLMRHPDWSSRPLRFDVIAYERIENGTSEPLWIKNAFVTA